LNNGGLNISLSGVNLSLLSGSFFRFTFHHVFNCMLNESSFVVDVCNIKRILSIREKVVVYFDGDTLLQTSVSVA